MYFKTAILIDAGFFKTIFRNQYNRSPNINDMKPFTDGIMKKVQSSTAQGCTDILHRIYYYDCRPYGGIHIRPDGHSVNFGASHTFMAANNYLKELETHPQLALRLGELSFDGWKVDQRNPNSPAVPDFKQKSVDMKIGLDIAWMASRRVVDKLVLVTSDSDFVSPMKLARKEGILVYLETMGQKAVKKSLKEHCDFLL